MSDPEALKLKAFLETYNLTFLYEQLLEQEADLEFLLGANDEELSSVVPKVVHKSKLRNAIAKLKAESACSGSLEPSTTNQQFQCPTSQVQQHVIEPSTTNQQFQYPTSQVQQQVIEPSTTNQQFQYPTSQVQQHVIEPSTSQLVLSNPLTTQFENFGPSLSSTFGQYESVSQPVVNQATTWEVITVPEANNSINPLQTVLQSSATGTTILQKTDLDQLDRRFITSAIVETCLLKVKKPSDTIRGEEWTKWTTYIKEIFPKEDPTMYYTPFKVSDGKCFRATGYIANRLIHIRRSISTHRTTKQCKKLLQNMKTERKNYYDTGNMGDLHLSTSLQPTNSDRVDRVETISVKTDPEDMIDIHDDVKERIERMYGMNKEELTKIPGTSESTNNNFAPTADFSYQGSYDGSHCGNSVLQDSTNNMDASYDNTYDTIYDDSVAPPPIKRKRPTSSSDNLNENYQAFSELVVAKLKSLPANRAALLQLKIQELLSREIVNLEMDEGDNETEEEVCGEQEGEEEEEMSLETGSKPNEIETPPSRSEECPNETTQVEHKTTTTTTSVTTTIAKKRKVAPAQVHDSAENKENAQVFLDDSYRAFSKCIVSQLRYLPTPVAVKTQNKIQRVLSDEISEFYNKTASASQEPEETSPSIRVKEEPLDYNDS